MQITKKFYTDLGFSESKAKELAARLTPEVAQDIKFYRDLGYSLMESEYLVINTFNEVRAIAAPARLGVPFGFGIKTAIKKQSIAIDSEIESMLNEPNPFDGTLGDFLDSGDKPFNAYDSFDEIEGDFDYSGDDTFDECVECDDLDETEVDYACNEVGINSVSAQSFCEDANDVFSISASPLANAINKEVETEEVYFPNRDESNFKSVATSPTSTIRTTVNTASFNYIKDNALKYRDIYTDAIRPEEIINYLDYNFTSRLNAEAASVGDKTYLLVGVKGDHVENIKNNIVILLDTSGSMSGSNVEMQKIIMTVLKQLKHDDVISLVTYSSTDRVIFEGLNGDNISDIILSLSTINIGGYTAGSTGLDRAYDIASEHFIEDGNNRVIIITDGDFNFGTYNTSELKQFIKEKKQTGVYLTVLGVSKCEIYEEQIMETLAREGNGSYYRLFDSFDILESCKNRFLNNTIAVAKDVKMQVEFNPARVSQYKLIGYESRNLSHDDFKNDKVEAETLGNDQVTVAIYELILSTTDKIQSTLKYQKVDTTGSTAICTVQINYKGVHVDDTESKTDSFEVVEVSDKISPNMNTALIGKTFVDFVKSRSKEDYKALSKLIVNTDEENDKINLISTLANILKGTKQK